MQLGGLGGEHVRIDGVSRLDAEPGFQDPGGQPAVVLHAHEREPLVGRTRCDFPCLPLLIARFVDRQLSKPRGLLSCCLCPGLDRCHDVAEVRRPESAELRSHQHIVIAELVDLPKRFPADEDREHLFGDRYRRLQFVGLIQRELNVDRNDDIDAHLANDIDRQVADEPAVHQQMAVDSHRRQRSRHGHAGANRERKIATVHDVHLARLDVGCDRAKRYGEIVKVLDVRYRERQVAEYEIELLALHEAERQVRPSSLEPDIQVDGVVPRILLAPESQVAAVRFVGHRVRPVHFRHQLLELRHAHARRVQASDNRPHARAGNGIDGYAHAFEFAQHADMRRAARTASAEHQSYSRSV